MKALNRSSIKNFGRTSPVRWKKTWKVVAFYLKPVFNFTRSARKSHLSATLTTYILAIHQDHRSFFDMYWLYIRITDPFPIHNPERTIIAKNKSRLKSKDIRNIMGLREDLLQKCDELGVAVSKKDRISTLKRKLSALDLILKPRPSQKKKKKSNTEKSSSSNNDSSNAESNITQMVQERLPVLVKSIVNEMTNNNNGKKKRIVVARQDNILNVR